jgi:hypothetical protein
MTVAHKMGAVWLLIHMDKNSPRNITARINTRGRLPNFPCSQDANRSSNWHLIMIENIRSVSKVKDNKQKQKRIQISEHNTISYPLYLEKAEDIVYPPSNSMVV